MRPAVAKQRKRHSHIFVLRTWIEEIDESAFEWRAMVRNVQSGETRYFRSWEVFITFMDRHMTVEERREGQPPEIC
jgi:hypothetical protein